jgi:RNA polymerase sigma-70 factor (ECF subfamily)
MRETEDPSPLLYQLKRGDDQAIEVLFARYAEGLYWYAIRKYRLSPEDADDAVQNTFCAIIENIQMYDEHQGKGRGWMYTICKNVILDSLRRKKPQLRLEDIERSSGDHSLDYGVMQQEWFAAVEQAWDQLSEGDRQELVRGRGRGPGRTAWHEAAQRFRVFLSSKEDPYDR